MDLSLTKVQNLGISLEFRSKLPSCVCHPHPESQPLAALFMMVHHQSIGYFRALDVSSMLPIVGNT